MTTAVQHMTCEEQVTHKYDQLKKILAKRGGFFEDEEVAYKIYGDILEWFKNDREESDRIELEALEAEKAEKERKRLADPNYQTKRMFDGVKIKIPEREIRR